jgi:hypothetical protein
MPKPTKTSRARVRALWAGLAVSGLLAAFELGLRRRH